MDSLIDNPWWDLLCVLGFLGGLAWWFRLLVDVGLWVYEFLRRRRRV